MPKEEKKFSISVDMGAKNNGIFIAKTKGDEIDKKAFLIKFDSINFSKKDRRENRHKVRNYKRRKLAKRLLQEFVDFSKYNDKQKESILGLLNNRGFTYLDGGSEFKQLNEESLNFIKKNIEDFPDISRQEEFTEYFTQELLNSKDEKNSKFEEILELETGSKPRSKYFKEIEEEINKDFGFIKDFEKKEFFCLVANISNLQLRVLRKYFNKKFDDKLDLVKLDRKIRGYFKVFHYKTEKEKKKKKRLI